MDYPSLESSQNEASIKGKQRSKKICQQTGVFECKHCTFRCDDKKYLVIHEKQHFANLPHRCPNCTFTAKNWSSILQHIKRVHKEQEEKLPDNTKEELVQTIPITESGTIDVDPKRDDDQLEDLSFSKQPTVQTKNNIPKTTEEVDITVDSDQDEEMSCICGQAQPVDRNYLVVSCGKCGNWFHGRCVGITPAYDVQLKASGEQFICPPCAKKEFFTTLEPTLATNASVTQTEPSLSTSSSHVPDLSHDESMSTTRVPPSPSDQLADSLSPQEEEGICRTELSKLAKEIQSAAKILLEKKNFLKEEDRLTEIARSKTTNTLRNKIEDLKKEDHRQTVHLIVLKESGGSFKQQLEVLATKKIQLELEINDLRQGSSKKRIKIEPTTVGGSSTDFLKNEEMMKQKENSLTNVKEKLDAIQKEETHQDARIQEGEKQKLQNALNLAKMRADLESLLDRNRVTESLSAVAVELKALVVEQRIRITRFASIQKKLIEVKSQYKLNEIERKKEEWLNTLEEMYGEK